MGRRVVPVSFRSSTSSFLQSWLDSFASWLNFSASWLGSLMSLGFVSATLLQSKIDAKRRTKDLKMNFFCIGVACF